jgi:hypothetical protein
MQHKRLKTIEKQIRGVKRELGRIGPMRPGSLTCQYKSPKEKKGAFYQLSYTHNMKSRTEYVRKEFVRDLQRQIANYRRFRVLTKRWVDLAIEYSRESIALAGKKV